MSSIFIGHNPYLYVVPDKPAILSTPKIGCRGFFRITSRVPDEKGRLRVHRQYDIPDWIPNLILDNGLDGIGTNGTSWATTIALGTGTDAPNVADTGLSGTVITVTGGTSTSGVYTAGTPRYYWENWSKTFAQGAATGTWTEIGIGRTSTNLWSRARILDSGGSPSSITVNAIEILTVEYRLEVYQDETEHTGTITIGGVTHDWTTRAYGTGIRPGTLIGGSFMNTDSGNVVTLASGALNANYVLPSSAITASIGNTSVATYSGGSYTKTETFPFTISQGNSAVPVTAAYASTRGFVAGKIGFDPGIAKDNTKTMALTFSWTWGRL